MILRNVKYGLLACLFAAAAVGCGQTKTDVRSEMVSTPSVYSEAESQPEEAVESVSEEPESSVVSEVESMPETPAVQTLMLGDYELLVKGVEYLPDYYNEPGLAVSFTFINHNSEFTCAYAALKYAAYQEEQRLMEETYFDRGTDMANLNKEVKNGDSTDCKLVFRPTTTKDLTFTVTSSDGAEESVTYALREIGDQIHFREDT